MPFTLSHAIVAVPFARTPLPVGAVAVGAMAPDLPLYFPWVPSYGLTHGWPSLLWVSVPIALVLYAIWRLAIRPAASGLLPAEALRSRMPWAWDRVRRPERPALSAVLVVAAVLLGVLTHVGWDLFTHPGRLGTEWIPALGETWGPLVAATWLQHASTALGLLGLTVWAVGAGRRAGVVHRTDPRAVGVIRLVGWLAAAGLLLASFGVELARAGIPTTYRQLTHAAFDAGTSAAAGILVLAVLASLAVRVARAADGRRMRG